MIPRWKLRRELDRAGQKLRAAVNLMWEPFVQRYHDRNRATRLQITPGAQALTNRVLVYLIFQADRILDSTVETCRFMQKQGYCTLVVSNAPLSEEALSRLASVSWQVMQRPNYGYDFGGYRDGILHLMDHGIRPDWLMILNDSVWFPLRLDDSLMQRMEQSGMDLTGTVVHRSFRTTWLRRQAIRVIESYLFLFNATAFNSPAFKDFWVNYRVSSIKVNAVHRGERRMAEAMLQAGLDADGLFDRESFLASCKDQDCHFLQKTLRYANYTTPNFDASRKDLLARFAVTEAWRQDALAHLRMVAGRNDFCASFPFGSVGSYGVPLLKRSGGVLQGMARKSFLRAIAAHDLPPVRETVMAELLAMDGSGPE